MFSRGLIPCGLKNPFVVSPSYHHWAPWIGPHTCRSNSVLNTEFDKTQIPKMPNDGDDEDLNDDEKINEEQLTDELVNLKVEEVRALCKQCGLDDKGSKLDLIMRLSEKMSNRVIYNKVLEKVWVAAGGWAVITCPCGVVYSV